MFVIIFAGRKENNKVPVGLMVWKETCPIGELKAGSDRLFWLMDEILHVLF